MSNGTGAISQLTIKAYADDEFTTQKGEFETLINPPEYTIVSDVDYHIAQSMGIAGGALQYNTSAPRKLNLQLHFDETFLPAAEKKKSVAAQIQELNDVVYKYQEEGHSPYYVRVIWGTLDFRGKLSKLSVKPTMFEKQGSPIRADVELVVLEDVEALNKAKKRAAEEAARRKRSQQQAAGAGAASGAAAGAASGAAAGAASPDGEGPDAAGQANDRDGTQGSDPTEEGASTTEHENGPPDGDPAAGTNAEADAAAADGQTVETKEGDSLTKVADDTYGDPNQAKSLASANGLDSMMPSSGLPALALPSLPTLPLLAMLMALLKKGLAWLKKKGSKALKKGKEMAGKAKKKTTDAAKKTKKKVSDTSKLKEKAKGKFDGMKKATQKRASQALNVKNKTQAMGNKAKEMAGKTKEMAGKTKEIGGKAKAAADKLM